MRADLPDRVTHKGRTYDFDFVSIYGEPIYSRTEDDKIKSVVLVSWQ